MRLHIGRLTVLASVALFAAAAARADEQKISADKLPKAVKDALEGRFPGAEVTSAEKETEEGKVVYDLELKHQGRKYEMDVREDGTIVEIEKEVKGKDVPEAINKAVKDKYPGCTIREVMEVNKVQGKEETPIHYEVTITTAEKKSKEVVVSLDGKRVRAEGEKDKE